MLRKRAGVTQRELAMEVNVSQSLISKIERGKTTPSPSLLHEISRVLASKLKTIEVKAADIMKELTEVNPSDSLYKVCELLLRGSRVTLGGKCITYRSLIKAAVENPGTPLTSIPAVDAIEEVVQVDENEPIIGIARLLIENDVVIVSKKGAAVGAITREDIIKTIKKYGVIPVKERA